ncbi:GNAT family N-acetyltransferase [Blastococcus sp. MG754427]|uniref:GNAT family N-acetyltransferase n=1 Tax=Blastococcus sp. MG754427 TaxID=2570318 RepID=UPI0035ABF78A
MDIDVDLYRREAYPEQPWWFGLLWVARCDGVPVGALQTRPDGELQMVAVEEAFEGRGVARALFQAAELHLGVLPTHDNEVSHKGRVVVERYALKASERFGDAPARLLPADEAERAARDLLSTVRGEGPRWLPGPPSDPSVYRAALASPRTG